MRSLLSVRLSGARLSVWDVFAVIGLPGVVFALYARTLNYGDVSWDDPAYLFAPWPMQQGLSWETLGWAFRTFEVANWHPLTWVSLLIDKKVHGDWLGGFHLTNMIFHAINSVLVWVLFRRAAAKSFLPLALALLFAMHPLAVESVAWISERKDVLFGFFWLLGGIAYQQYACTRSWSSYLLVTVFFAASLMSKPMAVTFPVVLLVADVLLFNRKNEWRRCVSEKLLWFLMSLGGIALTLQAQQLAMPQYVGWSDRLVLALAALWHYASNVVVPADLSFFYRRPDEMPWGGAFAGLCLTLCGGFLGWRWRKSRPWFAAGLLWFFLTLLPVLGLVRVGGQIYADRYTYIPAIGLYWIIAKTGFDLSCRKGAHRNLLLFLSAIWMAYLLSLSWTQVSVWESSEALYRNGLKRDYGNFVASANLALVQAESGKLDDADRWAEHALARSTAPEITRIGYYVKGTIALQGNDLVVARHHFERALAADSSHAATRVALAWVLSQQGEFVSAESVLRVALKLAPTAAVVHAQYGMVLQQLGRSSEAVVAYERSLRFDPLQPDIRMNLAGLYERLGAISSARAHWAIVARQDPNNFAAKQRLSATDDGN